MKAWTLAAAMLAICVPTMAQIQQSRPTARDEARQILRAMGCPQTGPMGAPASADLEPIPRPANSDPNAVTGPMHVPQTRLYTDYPQPEKPGGEHLLKIAATGDCFPVATPSNQDRLLQATSADQNPAAAAGLGILGAIALDMILGSQDDGESGDDSSSSYPKLPENVQSCPDGFASCHTVARTAAGSEPEY